MTFHLLETSIQTSFMIIALYVAGGDIDLVSEYDTSTREGREKLAKDIHQALTDSAVGRNVLMRNSFSNALSREEFRKEVEQSTYEHAMEEGASSRTVSGGSVIESMNQAAEEVNEQSSILEQYRLDEVLVPRNRVWD